MEEQLIAIFCEIDDFCNVYEEYCHHNSLPETTNFKIKSRLALRPANKSQVEISKK